MTTATLVKKIRDIEMELEGVKRAVKISPDFVVDEKNWEKIQPAVRKTRRALYREQYGRK